MYTSVKKPEVQKSLGISAQKLSALCKFGVKWKALLTASDIVVEKQWP